MTDLYVLSVIEMMALLLGLELKTMAEIRLTRSWVVITDVALASVVGVTIWTILFILGGIRGN